MESYRSFIISLTRINFGYPGFFLCIASYLDYLLIEKKYNYKSYLTKTLEKTSDKYIEDIMVHPDYNISVCKALTSKYFIFNFTNLSSGIVKSIKLRNNEFNRTFLKYTFMDFKQMKTGCCCKYNYKFNLISTFVQNDRKYLNRSDYYNPGKCSKIKNEFIFSKGKKSCTIRIIVEEVYESKKYYDITYIPSYDSDYNLHPLITYDKYELEGVIVVKNLFTTCAVKYLLKSSININFRAKIIRILQDLWD